MAAPFTKTRAIEDYLNDVFAPATLRITKAHVKHLWEHQFLAPYLFRANMSFVGDRRVIVFTALFPDMNPHLHLRSLACPKPDDPIRTKLPITETKDGDLEVATEGRIPERWLAMLADFGFGNAEGPAPKFQVTTPVKPLVLEASLPSQYRLPRQEAGFFEVRKGPVVTEADVEASASLPLFLEVDVKDVGSSAFGTYDSRLSGSAAVALRDCKGLASATGSPFPYFSLGAAEGGILIKTRRQSKWMWFHHHMCRGIGSHRPECKGHARYSTGRDVTLEELVVLRFALRRAGCDVSPMFCRRFDDVMDSLRA